MVREYIESEYGPAFFFGSGTSHFEGPFFCSALFSPFIDNTAARNDKDAEMKKSNPRLLMKSGAKISPNVLKSTPEGAIPKKTEKRADAGERWLK